MINTFKTFFSDFLSIDKKATRKQFWTIRILTFSILLLFFILPLVLSLTALLFELVQPMHSELFKKLSLLIEKNPTLLWSQKATELFSGHEVLLQQLQTLKNKVMLFSIAGIVEFILLFTLHARRYRDIGLNRKAVFYLMLLRMILFFVGGGIIGLIFGIFLNVVFPLFKTDRFKGKYQNTWLANFVEKENDCE